MENLYVIKYKKWKNVEFICDNIQKKPPRRMALTTMNRKS